MGVGEVEEEDDINVNSVPVSGCGLCMVMAGTAKTTIGPISLLFTAVVVVVVVVVVIVPVPVLLVGVVDSLKTR